MRSRIAGNLASFVLVACAAAPSASEGPSLSWAEVLLQSLGSPDVDERVRATEELAKKLPDVEELLRENLANRDPETAARCRDLLARLEPRVPERVWGAAGRVALVDGKGGRVAIDLRSRDGVRVGQKVGVLRSGALLGVLEITDVQLWGSWAKPVGGTSLDDVQKHDVASAVEER